VVVEETTEPQARSRRTLIAVTIGVVIAAVLVAYGFSRSDDDREPSSTTSTTLVIGVIQAPAQVATTQGVAAPGGTAPATNDVPTIPTGTADVAFPPVSTDIVVP
jgi:heme/copper-type cytochrome/quinol oxidase subunit 2